MFRLKLSSLLFFSDRFCWCNKAVSSRKKFVWTDQVVTCTCDYLYLWLWSVEIWHRFYQVWCSLLFLTLNVTFFSFSFRLNQHNDCWILRENTRRLHVWLSNILGFDMSHHICSLVPSTASQFVCTLFTFLSVVFAEMTFLPFFLRVTFWFSYYLVAWSCPFPVAEVYEDIAYLNMF